MTTQFQHLEKLVQQIQNDYSPLNNIDQKLFGRPEPDNLQSLIATHSEALSEQDRKRLVAEFFGWGPIEPFLHRTDICEIVLNGPDALFIETQHGLEPLHDRFLSPLTFRNFVQRLCQQSGARYTVEQPFANGSLHGFRIHLMGPPVTTDFHLTLRQHLSKSLDLEEYVTEGIMTTEQHQVLTTLISQEENLMIVGNTGSGKTTLLNSLLKPLDNDRIVFIEDTPELRIPNTLSARLLTRQCAHTTLPEVSQQELVKQALRMRPDRIVMGEIRDTEAKDFMQSLATGHKGSMGTIHASSPQQALYRLEMLIQMGAPQWDLQAIRRLIQLSLSHLIVIQKQGLRRQLQGIYRITGLESFGFLLETVASPKKVPGSNSGAHRVPEF